MSDNLRAAANGKTISQDKRWGAFAAGRGSEKMARTKKKGKDSEKMAKPLEMART